MILFFTPGPGWVVIMTALGVLAADFLWARRVLSWVRRMMARLRVAIFGPDLSHGGLTQVGHHPFAGHHSGRLFKSHRM
jgi:hypothetical protein